MNQSEVVNLMKSSNSEDEWNANCDKVKSACGGYPSFWYSAVLSSGLADETAKKWNGDASIKVSTF